MNKLKPLIALLLTAGLIFAAGNTAYAMGGNESTVSSTTPTIAPAQAEAAVPFASKGNLTLVDDPQSETSDEKQFITVKTKEGDTFYIVVDRAGSEENVYFMNLVDDADLKALIKTGPLDITPPAKEVAQPTANSATTPADATGQTESNAKDKTGIRPAMLILLLLVPFGCMALWFFKRRSRKPQVKGHTDLDTYDFDDEEEEVDTLIEDEDSEIASAGSERDPQ